MSGTRLQQRLRRVVASGARRLLAVTEPPAAPAPPPPPPSHARGPLPRAFASERNPATATLRARLSDDDVAAIRASIDADPVVRDFFAGAGAIDQQRLLLSYGMHFGLDPVVAHLGLPTSQPPDDVHAMARGPLAAAGGVYEADLVADALGSVGVELATIGAGLDFGCSSGRVLRVLATLYPHVAWHGCDPNGAAIAWARDALPGIRFFESPDVPPLDLADGALDLVYAISIWSHFAPQPGLRWFEEMRRVLKPGGHAVVTTHGPTTVDHDEARGLRTPEQAEEIVRALHADGVWYAAEFGSTGDWGVVNPGWGTAFMTPEWLLAHLCPRWELLEYAPGRNAENQDVYVLRRA